MLLYYLVKYAVWLCEYAHTVEWGQAPQNEPPPHSVPGCQEFCMNTAAAQTMHRVCVCVCVPACARVYVCYSLRSIFKKNIVELIAVIYAWGVSQRPWNLSFSGAREPFMKHHEWVEEPCETFWITVDWNSCGTGQECNTSTFLSQIYGSVFAPMSLKLERTCFISPYNAVRLLLISSLLTPSTLFFLWLRL